MVFILPLRSSPATNGADVFALKGVIRRLIFASNPAISGPVAFFIRTTITRTLCFLMALD